MNHFSQDPYGILDIPRDATKGQIRRAYRHLAKRLHPDRNPDDPEAEERFKKLQWAYESLRGQKEQDKISSMPFERKASTAPFSGTTHPFYSFFQAVRAYYTERKHTKETSSQRGKGNAGSNFTADH